MAYAEPDDVRNALVPDGATSPGTGTAASLSDAELSLEIANATAQVNGSLNASPTAYPLPFPDGEVPADVQALVVDIAAYLATLTYKKGSPIDAQAPVVLRYNRAAGILADLRSGASAVVGYGATPATQGAVINIVPASWALWPDRTFGAGEQAPG